MATVTIASSAAAEVVPIVIVNTNAQNRHAVYIGFLHYSIYSKYLSYRFATVIAIAIATNISISIHRSIDNNNQI